MSELMILPLPHRTPEMAARIHALQIAAYRVEARLLEVDHFPPLERTATDVERSPDIYLGALRGEELLGVTSLERTGPEKLLIASLTVGPDHHRQGIGRALVNAILQRDDWQILSVSTGAKNHPALALYQQLGFSERRRHRVGPEEIEVVELAVDRHGTLAGQLQGVFRD